MQPDRLLIGALMSDKKWFMFVLLTIIVFAMGGGSRGDISSLSWLRGSCALIAATILWRANQNHLRSIERPLLLLCLLGGVMILQLVPLPPTWWATLPGRDAIADIDQLLGIGPLWRPLTLSPSATWNSFASLIVPLVVLLLWAQLSHESRNKIPLLIVIAGGISATLGIAQVVLGGPDALHFYAVTNRGEAVGLFSNRNHNGVFVAICLLICLTNLGKAETRKAMPTTIAWSLCGILLFAGAIVNGSRAGLLCTLLAVGLSLIFQIGSGRTRDRKQEQARATNMPLIGSVALIVVLFTVFVVADRSAAVDRMVGQDANSGLRWSSLPAVLELTWDNFPFGVGFGAFEWAYRTVEPGALLSPSYFNEAHNDWLQLFSEGGLPAVLILFLAIWFLMRGFFRKEWTGTKGAYRDSADLRQIWGILLIIAVASLVDYPIRTPIFMLIASWAIATLMEVPRGHADKIGR